MRPSRDAVADEAQPGQAGRRIQLGRAGAGPAGELQCYAGPGRALIRPGPHYFGLAPIFRPDGGIIRPSHL
jgi:hypothetical protein